MPRKGQVIANPATGEYVEFIETAAETNGAYTRIKVKVIAGGFKPVMHLHSNTDETFEVISGELTCIRENVATVTRVGESITLAKGISHTHYNDGKEDLVMYQQFTPSLDIDVFLENLFGLNAEGKVPNGQPAFLQLMVWGKSYQCKAYVGSVPVSLQKILTFILAPVGRLLGYKAAYKRFSGYNA